ncbi:hypothetical protein K2173_026631 [Erythroxylum novogranatense]|uniref:Trichome birefringence-like C-terminal domain-containing protein n=1 Tax=Erythroxylum novogranatense TaxID=1862640 RepID=A0AAV8TZG9_9ROSI|nr:hypothetical protein K2173_026631 [Erythroxylum novogranatense]
MAEGIVKLHLDTPDENVMKFIPNFDAIVISSGHWFTKQSVHILSNETVGGQLWWPKESPPMKDLPFHAHIHLFIKKTEPGTPVDHVCTGKVKPLVPGELVENFTSVKYQKQVTGFDRSIKEKTNKSKLKLMDITEAFHYRHDGCPGPYRSHDPNKITKRSPNGRSPSLDCLHWCIPGPVDTWNELLLETIERKIGDSKSSQS